MRQLRPAFACMDGAGQDNKHKKISHACIVCWYSQTKHCIQRNSAMRLIPLDRLSLPREPAHSVSVARLPVGNGL